MPITLDSDKTEDRIIVPEKKVTVTYNKIKTISVNYDYNRRVATVLYERYLGVVLINEQLNLLEIDGADFTSINANIPNNVDTLGKQLKFIINKKIREILSLTGKVT